MAGTVSCLEMLLKWVFVWDFFIFWVFFILLYLITKVMHAFRGIIWICLNQLVKWEKYYFHEKELWSVKHKTKHYVAKEI